jgi:hypothetical protein
MAVSVRTGEIVQVSGIYQSTNCAHNVQRSFPKYDKAPPCQHCHQAVIWVLVQAAQTR